MSIYCRNCGNLLSENSSFCGKCGASLDVAGQPGHNMNRPSYPNGIPVCREQTDHIRPINRQPDGMYCPYCRNEQLTPVAYEDHMYFVCRRCGGRYRKVGEVVQQQNESKTKLAKSIANLILGAICLLAELILLFYAISVPAYSSSDKSQKETFLIIMAVVVVAEIIYMSVLGYLANKHNRNYKMLSKELDGYRAVGWNKFE